jgi:hypothetical protein
MSGIRWLINGRDADLQALFVRLAQARSEKVQQSKAIARRDAAERRRVREQDLHLKRVWAAIRRAIREQERRHPGLIHVFAPPRAGGRSSRARCRGLETMARLRVPRPSHVGRDGLSSFHFRWTGRGLGSHRGKRSRRYRAGEAVRHMRYICRLLAREIEAGGLVSNISLDPDHLAGFFAALEELEYQSVGDANVYVSVVVALPHELSSDEREALLAQICSVPGAEGLPYVGVLHAPDPDGDQRNYHAHIMLSLRPAEMIGENHYAFHVQKRSELNDAEFIYAWRERTAQLMNEAMERGGHKRRFTALPNDKRGLPPRPKGTGKSTPGAKHRERQAEQLDLFKAERAWRAELDKALQRVRRQVGALIERPAFDYGAVLANAADRMRSSLAARRTDIVRGRDERRRVVAALRTELADKIVIGSERLKNLAARLDDAGALLRARVARAQPDPTIIDPDKIAAVAAAISGLAKVRFLPLRKTGDHFELTKPARGAAEACRRIDHFDAEEPVQACYAEKWQEMLTELRLTLENAHEMPFVPRANGYALDRKAVDTELYDAVEAAGGAPDVQQVLQVGLRDWLDRQKREEERKKQADKEATTRQQKLDAFIAKTEAAGPEGRRWTRDQEDTVILPFRILARAAANGQVLVRRNGTGFVMATTEPHLRNFADMLDGSAAGRWALGRLANGWETEAVGTAKWATYWSSAPSRSPDGNGRDEGISAGRDTPQGGPGGSERD